jgi:mannose-6-phosphate isomerase-like protein (cupin superfamily)
MKLCLLFLTVQLFAQNPISTANAEHYTWGTGCDAWYLLKTDQLTIIEERMPPGTAETRHKHNKSRQFFFVLSGSATLEYGDKVAKLAANQGFEVPPGVPQRILNQGTVPLELVVTSNPPSHQDRIDQ